MSWIVTGIELLGEAVGLFEGEKKKKVEAALAEMTKEYDLLKGQQEINKAQATHRSIFVAGPRPFIMWVCGLAVASEFLVRPWALAYFPEIHIPTVSGMLFELMIPMLGLGGLRTYEKYKGLTK